MTVFQYHDEILQRFPSTIGGVIVGSGVQNDVTPAELQTLYSREQEAVKARLPENSLSELPALAAWRTAFRQFGVEPTKYRCAAEALLRRLVKKGDIPSINTLVDIGNLVSIRYALPVAVIDRRAVEGVLTVHFAEGTERYTELGQQEAIHPEVGEVVFTDVQKTVMARRWCWRQSEHSAAAAGTTDILVTIEAHHAQGQADVECAVQDMLALLRQYAGGVYTCSVLKGGNPSI